MFGYFLPRYSRNWVLYLASSRSGLSGVDRHRMTLPLTSGLGVMSAEIGMSCPGAGAGSDGAAAAAGFAATGVPTATFAAEVATGCEAGAAALGASAGFWAGGALLEHAWIRGTLASVPAPTPSTWRNRRRSLVEPPGRGSAALGLD